MRESKPIKINSKDVKIRLGADLKTRKKDAYNIGMALRGAYYNKDTGDKINVVEKSISEFLRHDVDFENKDANVSFAHLLSVSKIPEIIENSIYVNFLPNEDPKNEGKIETFDYYFIGLKIDGKDYTAKVVVAKNADGQKYYDHALSKIEKGKLIWHLNKSLSRGSDASKSLPFNTRDKRIYSLLQEKNANNPHFSFIDTRNAEELEALDRKHRELYERYKNGDQEAYEEAAKLVAEDAKRKDYEVKVYHGTGSDGFNVADASSKYEENGEGNQAHGAGLYMAVSRDVSEAYKNAKTGLTIKGQTLYQALRTPKGIFYDLSLKSIGYDSVLQLEKDLKRIAKSGFDRELNRIEKNTRN